MSIITVCILHNIMNIITNILYYMSSNSLVVKVQNLPPAAWVQFLLPPTSVTDCVKKGIRPILSHASEVSIYIWEHLIPLIKIKQ